MVMGVCRQVYGRWGCVGGDVGGATPHTSMVPPCCPQSPRPTPLQYYPEHAEMFMAVAAPVQRADMLKCRPPEPAACRLLPGPGPPTACARAVERALASPTTPSPAADLIMHALGGLYLDLDIECWRPGEQWLAGADVVLQVGACLHPCVGGVACGACPAPQAAMLPPYCCHRPACVSLPPVCRNTVPPVHCNAVLPVRHNAGHIPHRCRHHEWHACGRGGASHLGDRPAHRACSLAGQPCHRRQRAGGCAGSGSGGWGGARGRGQACSIL